MKKSLNLFSFCLLFAIFITACKKEKAQSSSDQIVGVWTLDNFIYNYHYSGADHTQSSTFAPTDTYEFRQDGTVLANVQGAVRFFHLQYIWREQTHYC